VGGVNAVGVMLGIGFYFIPPVKGRFRKQKVAFGYPKMICNLVMEYADGSRSSLVSDRSWKATSGPMTFSSLYGGEDYDARLLPEKIGRASCRERGTVSGSAGSW